MKILPFSEDSPIKNYGVFAFPIGCLLAEPNFSSNYIFNNFLKISPEYKLFYTTKWSFLEIWRCFRVKRFAAYSYDSFITQIEKKLDDNWYVLLNINERYIPNRYSYMKRDFLHDNYICGYDQEQKKFLVYGYDANMQFVAHAIDYKLVYQSYSNSITRYLFWNMFFKVKKKYDCHYVSNSKVVRNLIFTYKTKNKYYGANLYDLIIQQLQQRNCMNLRYYRYIMEYKALLVDHSCYFKNMEIFNRYNEQILSLAKRTFSLAIKYKVLNNSNNKLKQKIIDYLTEMKNIEIEIYETYFDKPIFKLYRELPLLLSV